MTINRYLLYICMIACFSAIVESRKGPEDCAIKCARFNKTKFVINVHVQVCSPTHFCDDSTLALSISAFMFDSSDW